MMETGSPSGCRPPSVDAALSRTKLPYSHALTVTTAGRGQPKLIAAKPKSSDVEYMPNGSLNVAGKTAVTSAAQPGTTSLQDLSNSSTSGSLPQ